MVHYPSVAALHPITEMRVRPIILGEVQQPPQIEFVRNNARSCTGGIVCVTILLDMRGNHQPRLAQIQTLRLWHTPCTPPYSEETSYRQSDESSAYHPPYTLPLHPACPKRNEAALPDVPYATPLCFRRNRHSPYIRADNHPLRSRRKALPGEAAVVRHEYGRVHRLLFHERRAQAFGMLLCR